MARVLALIALAAAGCGLSVVGAEPSSSVAADGGAAAIPPRDGDAPRAAPDGGDATGLPDAALDTRPDSTDAPDPTKVILSYSAGKDKKVYRFDIAQKTFTALPSAGCPSAEETAVTSAGLIVLTSSDNQGFFRLTPTGCTPIKLSSSFPYALGTAPIGTVSATEEAIVGYMGAGDYVRVNVNDGAVTTITAGALGTLRPAGDVTAVGKKGYLAAAGGTGADAFACASGGDCIVEINLATGRPVVLVQRFAGLGIYGLAHSRGDLLFYASGQVFSYDLATKTLGPSLAAAPSGADFSGAAAAPFPGP